MTGDHIDGERIVAWALEELESAEAERISAHLDDCERCREEAAATRGIADTLGRAPTGEAPGRVLVSLLEAQAARRPRPRTWGAFGRTPALVTAVAVVALFVAGFWAGRRSVEGPSRAEEPLPARARLPEPPRIPFASA